MGGLESGRELSVSSKEQAEALKQLEQADFSRRISDPMTSAMSGGVNPVTISIVFN